MTIAMHCNLRLPNATPVVLRFDYKAHTRIEVGQPSRFWLITFFVTLWPWPLTFRLWTVTFVMYWLWCDQTQYQILANSNHPWLSCSDLKTENLGQSPPWISLWGFQSLRGLAYQISVKTSNLHRSYCDLNMSNLGSPGPSAVLDLNRS